MAGIELNEKEISTLSKVKENLQRCNKKVGETISSEALLFWIWCETSYEHAGKLMDWLILNNKIRFHSCFSNGQSEFKIISLEF